MKPSEDDISPGSIYLMVDISPGSICRRAFTFNNTLPLGAPAAEVYFRLSKTCHIFLEIVLQDALISETGCMLHFFASPPPFSSLVHDFYRTQVNLGSDLWVRMSQTKTPCVDLTDVTLADEDYQLNTN